MAKVYDMDGVRGGERGFPVELWRDDKTGRLVVRGFNEGGFASVDIDLGDLCAYFRLPFEEANVLAAVPSPATSADSSRGPQSL